MTYQVLFCPFGPLFPMSLAQYVPHPVGFGTRPTHSVSCSLLALRSACSIPFRLNFGLLPSTLKFSTIPVQSSRPSLSNQCDELQLQARCPHVEWHVYERIPAFSHILVTGLYYVSFLTITRLLVSLLAALGVLEPVWKKRAQHTYNSSLVLSWLTRTALGRPPCGGGCGQGCCDPAIDHGSGVNVGVFEPGQSRHNLTSRLQTPKMETKGTKSTVKSR